ncbi:MAG: SDR family NAD(P)-dependent oxidoreductase [Caldilineaceae bacterium]
MPTTLRDNNSESSKGQRKEFRGKVAVITGAASRIGFALTERCVQEGMKVVLADVEEPALRAAEARLRATGAVTVGVVTDVSQETEVQKLAQTTLQTFGGVHLLCNNAGVSAGTTVWQSSLADWQWVLGVNLWGVIYGIRTFVPIMLAQASESHIVNTVSLAGMVSFPGMAALPIRPKPLPTNSQHRIYSSCSTTCRLTATGRLGSVPGP